MKKNLIILLLVPISIALPGCHIFNGILGSKPSELEICKQLTWDKVKTGLSNDVVTDEALNDFNDYINYECEKINSNQVNDILNIYNSTQDVELQQEIIKTLATSSFIAGNEKILDLYKSFANSPDRVLAPLGLRVAIYRIYQEDSERWQDWLWSEPIRSLLEEAVNKDLYKLSSLDYFELLALANKYPDSLFTKGCKEYVSFTEGIYFGFSRENTDFNQDRPVFRQPFNPEREIQFWPEFLKKYPDHPASDDAMYRMARAYEVQGDYENALLWYYNASQAPDGDRKESAGARFLFIMDMLMSSDSLEKLIQKSSLATLSPYIIYSKAVQLIREDKLVEAQKELESFLVNYKGKRIKHIISSQGNYIDDEFWKNIEKQIENIKKLQSLRNKQSPEDNLYEEASFWFNYELIAYNYLWQGSLQDSYKDFLPKKWEGVNTYIQNSITFEAVQAANKNYKLQNHYLRSTQLFEKLIQNYPNSKLVQKAKYSIARNYYYLDKGIFPTLTDQAASWNEMAIKAFNDFVAEFPQSSMADDALFSMAYISNSDLDKLLLLKRQLKDYPNGDRKKEAEKILKDLEPNFTIGVGIRMKEVNTITGVMIVEVLPGLPASESGLQSGDIIFKVDGQDVARSDDVKNIILKHQPGEIVRFEIESEGQRKVVEVVTKLMPLAK